MSNQYFEFLKPYNPASVMKALAACADKYGPSAAVIAKDVWLSFSAPAIEGDAPRYKIAVRGFRERNPNDKSLADVFNTIKTELDVQRDAIQPIDMTPEASGYRSVAHELRRLVFHQTQVDFAHINRHLQLFDGEHLSDVERVLYHPPAQIDVIVDLSNNAKSFLVQHRSAVCPDLTSQGSSLKNLFLWLTNDEDRNSWYDMNFFSGAIEMRVLKIGDRRIAFDDRFSPYQGSLDALMTITEKCPSIFNQEPPNEDAAFLWMFIPESESYPRPAYTGQVIFTADSVPLTPKGDFKASEVAYPDIEIISFVSDELGYQQIKDAASSVGYRLYLRRTPYVEFDDVKLEQLEQERLQLQEEIDTLRELHGVAPRLYRFGHRHIAALVELLSQYDPQNLRHIRYGFHASTNDQYSTIGRQVGERQPGMHYLWIDGDIMPSFYNNFYQWRDNAGDVVEFWLDPRWAHTYRHGTRAAVFVPMGTVLGPDFHSWEIETMDDYLKLVAAEWYHGENNVQKYPDTPIFVFEAANRNATGDVRLSLLDMDKFQPITDPSIIGWHNDTLQVIYSTNGVEEFIQIAASYERRSAHVQQQQRQLDLQLAELEKQKALVMAQIETNMQEMLGDISALLADLEKRAVSLLDAGKPLNARLHALQNLHKQTEALTNETIRDTSGVHEEIQKLGTEIEKLVTQSETVLTQAEERRRTLIDAINSQLVKLLKVRETITAQITGMLRD